MSAADDAKPIPLLFETLQSVGYTECAHPRVKVNVTGELDAPLTHCYDCGAKNGVGGSLDYLRLPWRIS